LLGENGFDINDLRSVADLTMERILQLHRGLIVAETKDRSESLSFRLEERNKNIDFLIRSGAGLLFKEFNTWCPEISRLLHHMAGELGHTVLPVGANVFCGKDSVGLDPHYHRVAALAIQINGKKRFNLCPGDIPNPVLQVDQLGEADRMAKVREFSPEIWAQWHDLEDPFRLPPSDAYRSVVLEPGMSLFIPPGYWHATAAESDTSLSISFFFDFARYGELVALALRNGMFGDDLVSQAVPVVDDGEDRERVQASFCDARDRVIDYLKSLDGPFLAQQIVPPDQRAFRDNDHFRMHPDAHAGFKESGRGTTIVKLKGLRLEDWEFEGDAVSVLKFLLTRKDVVQFGDVCQAFSEISPEAIEELMGQICNLGVLVRLPYKPKE
jgi:hypothetical protein